MGTRADCYRRAATNASRGTVVSVPLTFLCAWFGGARAGVAGAARGRRWRSMRVVGSSISRCTSGAASGGRSSWPRPSRTPRASAPVSSCNGPRSRASRSGKRSTTPGPTSLPAASYLPRPSRSGRVAGVRMLDRGRRGTSRAGAIRGLYSAQRRATPDRTGGLATGGAEHRRRLCGAGGTGRPRRPRRLGAASLGMFPHRVLARHRLRPSQAAPVPSPACPACRSLPSSPSQPAAARS
jgi:hypothetical protein